MRMAGRRRHGSDLSRLLQQEQRRAQWGKLRAGFLQLLTIAGIPQPVLEYRFHPVRQWRLDAAWPEALVGVELQGGTFTGGSHVQGVRYANDCDKLNAAQALGWRVLWFTVYHIERKGLQALEPLEALLDRPPPTQGERSG